MQSSRVDAGRLTIYLGDSAGIVGTSCADSNWKAMLTPEVWVGVHRAGIAAQLAQICPCKHCMIRSAQPLMFYCQPWAAEVNNFVSIFRIARAPVGWACTVVPPDSIDNPVVTVAGSSMLITVAVFWGWF